MSNLKELAEELVRNLPALTDAEQVEWITRHIQSHLRMEFALLPVDVDEGEIDSPVAVVPITLADIEDGFTIVGRPPDMSTEDLARLADVLKQSQESAGSKQFFCILDGQIGDKYRLLRVIPKAAYDEDFAEQTPSSPPGS